MTMVHRTTLNRLIDRAAGKGSSWSESAANFDAIARQARVQHAAEVLLQLGYGSLAGDLLRLEKKKEHAPEQTVPAA
jgi:hypothetical protein